MTTATTRLNECIGATLRALLLAGLTAVLVFGPVSPDGHRSALAASETPQDEFEQRVRAYLLAHPEVIVEAMQGLEARQREADQRQVQVALKERADEIFRDPQSPVGGNPQGDVTLVEFFDYNCGFCRRMGPVMIEAEAADPQLRIVYKEFPILGAGSTYAAKAALAAERQGLYGEFHKTLMAAKSPVDEALVLFVAKQVGLDVERLKTDIEDPAIHAMIDRNLQLAQALKINGTPGFVAGDRIYPGATDLATLKNLIEQARTSGK